MNEPLKKSLLVNRPALILGLGLIAPLLADVSLPATAFLGACAAIVLFFTGLIIAFAGNKIPKNARIGIAALLSGGIWTVVTIAAAPVLRPVAVPFETILPLALISAVLAADGEGYSGKKKLISVLFDGLGIGTAFTVLLILASMIRDGIGKNQFLGQTLIRHMEPLRFFATAPGILLLAAFIALCVGVVLKRKKQGGSS